MIEQFLTSQQVYFQLARFVIAIIAGTILTRTVLMPLTRRAMTRKGSDVKAKHSMENIVGLTGLFATFIVALQAGDFGNLVSVLGTIAAALTVTIGFGMRDQVSSVVAGIFIHTDNPFVKGDYIKVNDFEGVVKEIKLRATTLNGKNDEKQIVPNNILTTNVVKNQTKGRKTRSVIELKLAAKDLEKASELLVSAVSEHEDVLGIPEPEINYIGVEDDKVDTKLSYWLIGSENVKKIRSDVLKSFSRKMKEKGLYKEKEE